MEPANGGQYLLETFRKRVDQFEAGDLTRLELVNEVLIKLAAAERFDLAEETIGLLPESLRDELRRNVGEILEAGSSYKGLFIIGRASDDWWQKVRNGAVRLAGMMKPILDSREKE
jgi:hypothetical protein